MSLAPFLKASVQAVLEHPWAYDWSLQGFGMLRTYFGEGGRYRLNVWDKRFRVANVSLIHDHPWHFSSVIVAGRLHNQRFIEAPGETHVKHNLKTGPGCTFRGEPKTVCLVKNSEEHYSAGDIYYQQAHEVHLSDPEDGTVTLNDRTRLPDGEHAYVFWPVGESWVSAEPRPALIAEVRDIIVPSLARWFQ